MSQPPTNGDDAADGYVQDPLPPLQIEVTPEEEVLRQSGPEPSEQEDFGKDLNDFRFAELQSKLEDLTQQLTERKDLHELRKRHARSLFRLTLGWVGVVWLVILLQGFNQWPTPFPWGNYIHLPFKLSDTVIIAFMTTTTATVLGLYGIAAYWLYGKPKSNDDKTESGKSNKSE